MSMLKRYIDPKAEIIMFAVTDVINDNGEIVANPNEMEPGEGETPFESIVGGKGFIDLN